MVLRALPEVPESLDHPLLRKSDSKVGLEKTPCFRKALFKSNHSFWTRTTVKSALSPCPRRRITYIRMCSEYLLFRIHSGVLHPLPFPE